MAYTMITPPFTEPKKLKEVVIMVKRKSPVEEHLTLYSLRPAISELERLVEATLAPFDNLATAKVVVTIQPAGNRKAAKANGWTAKGYRTKANPTLQPYWSTKEGEPVVELNLIAEKMRRPILDIMETVVHECAHICAVADGVQTTSSGGYYHNKKFIPYAKAVGLDIDGLDGEGKPLVKSIGYGLTKLSDALREKLVNDFQPNEAAFNVFRNLIERPKSPRPPKFECLECHQTVTGNLENSVKLETDVLCGRCMVKMTIRADA